MSASIDRKKFFDAIRPHINLTTQNVFGCGKILDYIEQIQEPTNWAAYELATAYWETASTWTPIHEYGSQAYLKSKKYWPYVGMGLIEVTWRANYIKAAKLLGLPDTHFIDTPADLLKWEYAIPLLIKGMTVGLYTGKKLSDYIDMVDDPDSKDLKEYIAARHIVNGSDKASRIGELAIWCEHGLRAAGYDVESKPIDLTHIAPAIPPTPTTPVLKPPVPPVVVVGDKPSTPSTDMPAVPTSQKKFVSSPIQTLLTIFLNIAKAFLSRQK